MGRRDAEAATEEWRRRKAVAATRRASAAANISLQIQNSKFKGTSVSLVWESKVLEWSFLVVEMWMIMGAYPYAIWLGMLLLTLIKFE